MTESRVIDPTDIKALQIGTDKPMATLITCTPPGTALKRLLIYAEQISPDPGAVTATQSNDTPATDSNGNSALVGNEPTLLDQIWNFFF
jgi:sortase A